MPQAELLSPAGSWDCLKAAAQEGADAVYLGAGEHNARRRAENFAQDSIKDVVGYCHGRGIRCYLALNTLVKDSELDGWARLVEDAYAAGADAVIVQDTALIGLLKDSFPDLQIHVSTQAGVFNRHWKRLLEGADRVIMPREMTLNQVREFGEKTKLPVEVFVQGALCFSISGQCLMSSFLGGRSGNRGMCAQPCRKKYGGRYLLSTADLCLVEKLPKILDSGVCSLKIEGRLRSPEYVGAATALYRRALDSISLGEFKIDSDAYTDLELSFSREYTEGGMFKKYDVVASDECGKRGVFAGVLEKGGMMRLQAPIMKGDGVGIFKSNGSHGDIIRRMEKNGRQTDKADKGDTVRLAINAHPGDRIYVTSGVTRRKPYPIKPREKIHLSRRGRKMALPQVEPASFKDARLLVKAYSLNDAHAAMDSGASAAYYNVFEEDYPIGDPKVCPYVPRCLFDWGAKEALNRLAQASPKSALCGDLGVASELRGQEVILDLSCNAFNGLDVRHYNGLGMVPVVSPELTFDELRRMGDKRFVVYAHGRIPLMTTKYALDERVLKDEMGYAFPVRQEADERQVLNSVPLGLFDAVGRMMEAGIAEYLLDLECDVAETVAEYRRIMAGDRSKKHKGYTTGHLKDGVP